VAAFVCGGLVSARRGPAPLKDRVRRLLVVLPWLMERGSASIGEMCERFQVSERELVADLEQVALCGLPPFLDEMIDLYIDEGVAHVGVPRFFTRPLRLTAPEAFTLVTALRAALTMPGADAHGPLARALAKLEQVLGDDGLVVDLGQPPATADLIAAAERHERVRLEYWSAASGEVTDRLVTSRAVFTDRGHWYLLADDDRSGDERRFRIDRVVSWQLTGEFAERREVSIPNGDDWFDDAHDSAVVMLSLDPSARWVIERFPIRSVTEEGDRLITELVVANERWLRQLMVRLGPAIEVIQPVRWRGLAAAEASAVLAARYAGDD
jgi:proteasome accessory factor C